jgi:site-specific DNA-methyltransferase (adenine-specific)
MKTFKSGSVELMHMDCMEYMRGLPDKAFDLAIVDPPYGIDAANVLTGPQRKSGNGAALKTGFEKKDWDLSVPNIDYFDQLMRISINQIVWGANYMSHMLPPSMGWIVWDKDNGTTNFSDCELAFTSFEKALRKYKYTWNGMLQGDMKNKEQRIHPTQKPVKLYQWLLSNYAKEGDRILDTHLGSGSSAIAAHYAGFEFVGMELDADYYAAAVKRFQHETAQQALNI